MASKKTEDTYPLLHLKNFCSDWVTARMIYDFFTRYGKVSEVILKLGHPLTEDALAWVKMVNYKDLFSACNKVKNVAIWDTRVTAEPCKPKDRPTYLKDGDEVYRGEQEMGEPVGEESGDSAEGETGDGRESDEEENGAGKLEEESAAKNNDDIENSDNDSDENASENDAGDAKVGIRR